MRRLRHMTRHVKLACRRRRRRLHRSAPGTVTGDPEGMDEFPVRFIEALCLGTSLAFSGICYYLYRKRRITVEKLDDAPHLAIDGCLKDILKVTPGACLQYAVIEGTVQPVGEPITSHFQKEIHGVLQRLMLKEHRLVWSSLSHTWMDSEQILLQRVNEVPFALVGTDETTVKVLCPQQASGVHMEMTHEKFHQINYGLGDIVGQYLSGEKLKGQLETEEMLKVGATLTGVGELTLDTDGSLYLRPPNGLQYFLSITDFDTLRGDQERATVLWKVLAVGFALAGVAVLLWAARRHYNHLKVCWERAAVTGPEDPQDGTENRIENACVICLSQPRNCILLDCGHACCCYNCYQALPDHRCPICRQNI
uniref:RING-type E3 ubiquitin transferase n=2 Tax=Monopterus albus TaxID=43700 RepID=A0A3Q3JYA7_MONAL